MDRLGCRDPHPCTDQRDGLACLADEVDHGAGLQLYQSFTDPRAMTEKVYPFMLTGPVSPLSFTAAPVFLQVFTVWADTASPWAVSAWGSRSPKSLSLIHISEPTRRTP